MVVWRPLLLADPEEAGAQPRNTETITETTTSLFTAVNCNHGLVLIPNSQADSSGAIAAALIWHLTGHVE